MKSSYFGSYLINYNIRNRKKEVSYQEKKMEDYTKLKVVELKALLKDLNVPFKAY